jgi:hypothetical protein
MNHQLSSQNMLFYTAHKTNHNNVKFLTHVAGITVIRIVSVLTMLQKHIITVAYNTTSQLLHRCSLLHVHQRFKRTQCFQNCFLPNLHCCESINLILQKQMHKRTNTHMGMVPHALFSYTGCIFYLLPLHGSYYKSFTAYRAWIYSPLLPWSSPYLISNKCQNCWCPGFGQPLQILSISVSKDGARWSSSVEELKNYFLENIGFLKRKWLFYSFSSSVNSCIFVSGLIWHNCHNFFLYKTWALWFCVHSLHTALRLYEMLRLYKNENFYNNFCYFSSHVHT